jgi:hypothetical protein
MILMVNDWQLGEKRKKEQKVLRRLPENIT